MTMNRNLLGLLGKNLPALLHQYWSSFISLWPLRTIVAIIGWIFIGDAGSSGAGVAVFFFALWPWRGPDRLWKQCLYVGLIVFGVTWGFVAGRFQDAVYLSLFVVFAASWVTPDAIVPKRLRPLVKKIQSTIIQSLAVLAIAGLSWVLLKDQGEWQIISLAFSVLAWLFFLGRRHGALNVEELMENSGKQPPVLYLRSFVFDNPQAKKKWYMRSLELKLREEEVIVPPFSMLGPVIAIGKPNEGLPRLGASRTYVSDKEWQGAVLELMRQACFVVIAIGDSEDLQSEGLQWEIHQAIKILEPTQLLFYLAQDQTDDDLKQSLTALSATLRSVADWTLPDVIKDERLVAFDADGKGSLIGPLPQPTQLFGSLGLLSWILVPIQTIILRRRFAKALAPLVTRYRVLT